MNQIRKILKLLANSGNLFKKRKAQQELAVTLEESYRRQGINFKEKISVEIIEVENTLSRIKLEGSLDQTFSVEESARKQGETTKIVRRLKKPVSERWVFVILAGLDQGRKYVGLTEEIKIGRLVDNHIQLRDPKVSRFHAVIRFEGLQPILEDLGSTNGTRVNDQMVHRKKRLFSGDRIKVGETIIQVTLEKG